MEKSWRRSRGTFVSLALFASSNVFFRVVSHLGPIEPLLDSLKRSGEAHVAAGCVVV